MTREELQTLAKAKNVNPATIRRWIRLYGEAEAKTRTKVSFSEAGRRSREVSGDGWVWDRLPARPTRVQSRGAPFDW